MTAFDTAKHIHFVGIGGIGVSALARMMLHRGKKVTGSDRVASRITDDLVREGVRFVEGHRAESITSDVDVVIYSPAIPSDSPELARAREFGIPMFTYPEALGKVSEGAYTIAVSGTHGKTTTTAMIADVLKRDINPTVIVGSLLSGGRSNFVPGNESHFVVEACEYKRSFLSLTPNILVITNIDEDHLDYYKDLADIESAFCEIARKVPADGFIVADIENDSVKRVLKDVVATTIDYRKLYNPQRELAVMGKHNQMNAAAAQSVGDILNIDPSHCDEMLKKFAGTWRRSELKGTLANGALVYDDYAHHPTEITTTIAGFAERFPSKELIVVFQPHLYSRTREHFDHFVTSFGQANRVIVAPIYAAREQDDGMVSHHDLVRAMQEQGVKAEAFDSLDAITEALRSSLGPDSLVLTMGAGDIYHVGEALLKG
jgi:UDP-N-acetylmuramate--alanine ligase